MGFNKELCEKQHQSIDKEFDAVWQRLNGQDRKLWAIILILLTQLAAFAGALFLAWGKSLMVY